MIADLNFYFLVFYFFIMLCVLDVALLIAIITSIVVKATAKDLWDVCKILTFCCFLGFLLSFPFVLYLVHGGL